MTETELQLWDACLETGLCDEHALERARVDRAAAVGRGERVDLLGALASSGVLSETQVGILRRAIQSRTDRSPTDQGRTGADRPVSPSRRPVPRHRRTFLDEADTPPSIGATDTEEAGDLPPRPKPAPLAPLPLDASLPPPTAPRRVSVGEIVVGLLAVAAIVTAAAGAIFVLPRLAVPEGPQLIDAPPPGATPVQPTGGPAEIALAAAVSFAEQHPERIGETRERLDALAAAHGETLGDALAAARSRIEELHAVHRAARLERVRAKADRLRDAGDPLGAALALLDFPQELRVAEDGEKWAGAFADALKNVQKSTGMALVPGNPAPEGSESPGTPVRTFLIDLTEVSNSAYAEFVAETGARPPAHWRHDRPTTMLTSRPVVGITAAEAAAYAKWSGKRLPTAVEWQLAAAGPDGWRYPWGETHDPARSRAGLGETAGPHNLAPTRTHADGRALCGAYHLVGNAAEWVDGAVSAEDGGSLRLVLGGCALQEKPGTRTRELVPAETKDPALLIGFRCAKDVR